MPYGSDRSNARPLVAPADVGDRGGDMRRVAVR